MQDIWDSYIQAMREKDNSLYGILRMAEITFNDDLIQVGFRFAFHRKRFIDKKCIENVTDYYLNKGMKVKVEVLQVGQKAANVKAVVEAVQDEDASNNDKFFISDFTIKNFRVFDTEGATFKFQEGLNVVLGENNTGKSALIDGLRYVLNLGSYQKKEDIIRIDDQDINLSHDLKDEEVIEFTITFLGSAETMMSELPDVYSHIDENGLYVFRIHHKLILKLNKELDRHVYKTSTTMGGENLDQPVSNFTLDKIRSVYLSALRDIVEDEKKVGPEVERLIKSQVKSKSSELELLNNLPLKIKNHVLDEIHKITGKGYIKEVGTSLMNYSGPYIKGDPESIVTFTPKSVNKNLYKAMAPVFSYDVHGEMGLDLEANGLGINNLIYASIVLSRKLHDDEYRFFLIEEPEAHLHPQICRTFFEQLNTIKRNQVIVTSHSSQIASEVDLRKVIVMRRAGGKIVINHLSDVYQDTAEDEVHIKYLLKFFDATKSQMLFSRGVIFVEGISEALILRKFSKLLGKDLVNYGVEIVIIGAKAGFSHFKPIFDNDTEWKCAVLTDNDCAVEDVLTSEPTIPTAAGNPKIFEGVGTYEYELLKAAKAQDDLNGDTQFLDKIRNAFSATGLTGAKTFFDPDSLELSYKRMKDKALENEWGDEGLKTNGNFNKAKSEFSFQLQESLTDSDIGIIPDYIKAAIDHVTNDGTE